MRPGETIYELPWERDQRVASERRARIFWRASTVLLAIAVVLAIGVAIGIPIGSDRAKARIERERAEAPRQGWDCKNEARRARQAAQTCGADFWLNSPKGLSR